jgi:hypothetical protein
VIETVAFPGGHVAILTSPPYRKKAPVNGKFVDAPGKSARGPKSSSSTCPSGHKSGIDCTAIDQAGRSYQSNHAPGSLLYPIGESRFVGKGMLCGVPAGRQRGEAARVGVIGEVATRQLPDGARRRDVWVRHGRAAGRSALFPREIGPMRASHSRCTRQT